jgi:dsDNA-specific endonuclease/ATPase MutS2
MTQPEALRLAGELECGFPVTGSAAAELRRLHEAHDWQYRMAGERLRRVEKLEAQRDALLEALKAAEPYLRHADVAYNVYVQARAAIKAAEEEWK